MTPWCACTEGIQFIFWICASVYFCNSYMSSHVYGLRYFNCYNVFVWITQQVFMWQFQSSFLKMAQLGIENTLPVLQVCQQTEGNKTFARLAWASRVQHTSTHSRPPRKNLWAKHYTSSVKMMTSCRLYKTQCQRNLLIETFMQN